MTHIAMIIPTIEQIGGAERQLLLLCKGLAARGRRVTVIALSGTAGVYSEELTALGVAFLSLEMRKAWIDPRGWGRYVLWASQNRPDIVHSHLPHATLFARCVRLLTPVRALVDTLHTSSMGGFGRRRAYHLTNSLTNCVSCVSQSVADSAVMGGVAPRENLTILPNGVVVSGDPSGPRRTNAMTFQWLAAGRLSRVKDYPTLLRAFGRLPNNAHLQIAGVGPEEIPLRKLVTELKIEGRVQFAGFRQDIQPLLAAADAFVLSSLWEGLPMSVLEASAQCLPVVVTDGRGTRETIQPTVTGLIVPVGDVEALAQAMAEVMAMPADRRIEMGARGRRFVEEHFSLPRIVDRWESLYSRLLAEHPHPSRNG